MVYLIHSGECGLWAKQEKGNKGTYPDSCIETQGLKRWVNEHSGIAIFWADLHTGRFGDPLNTTILDIRISGTDISSDFNNTHLPLILQFYKKKGTINEDADKWSIGFMQGLNGSLDYAKHDYANNICCILSAMLEMHIESTGYGADGYTNNTGNGIKSYVLQIRQLIIYVVNMYINKHNKVLLPKTENLRYTHKYR